MGPPRKVHISLPHIFRFLKMSHFPLSLVSIKPGPLYSFHHSSHHTALSLLMTLTHLSE